MKKLYLLLVMLCVAVASWADVTATFLANSGNQTVTNGKGFLWNHTAYEINVGQVGDLAAADLSALSDASNPDNKYNMNNGTYFVIKGKLNPSDMAAIDSRLGSSVNPVYIDFAQAQFVDAEGNDITDGSLIANMNNSKVKYVVLPDNTTEINSEGWPATVEEAIAVNQTAGKFFGFATYDKNGNGGAGTLEHLIAFDNRPYKNANVTDYTLTGTYWHQSVKNSLGDYEDVISLMYKYYGYNEFNCKSLNLENATMLSYGEEIERVLTVTADDGRVFTYKYHEDSNALRSITFLMNSIESVKLPTTEGTTLIPYMAFDQCHKITEVDIPGNISYIGTAAFSQCDGITDLTFHKGLTSMGSNCFWKCKSLKSVALPVGLENIGTYAFIECDALEDVVIPEGVKRLETGCFEQTNIISVRLPNSLEYIDANAFRQCLNLKTITIPENVKEIGSNAFARCNKITDVYFLGTTTIPKAAADAFESELYYHNKTANMENVEVINIDHPGVVLPDYPEAAVHSTDPVYQRDKVKLTTWATYVDGEKVNGAAVMHYPRVKQTAEYSDELSSSYVTSYVNAQNNATVNPDETLYVKNEDGTYSKLFGMPEEGKTYYLQSVVGSENIIATDKARSDASVYYADEQATTEETPTISENEDIFYNCGEQDTYSDAVYALQKDESNNWITEYYTKDNEGKYHSSPYIYFNDQNKPLYYNPVSTEVPNYTATQTPVSGVTTYYNNENGETVVNPTLAGDYYVPGSTYVTNYTIVNNWDQIPASNIKEHYYTLSNGVYSIATPAFNTGKKYYIAKDGGYEQIYNFIDEFTDYYEPDQGEWINNEFIPSTYKPVTSIQFAETVYFEDGQMPVYEKVTEYNPANTYYRYQEWNNSYVVADQIQFSTNYYYENGTKIATTYSETNYLLPDVETYYAANYNKTVFTEVTDWNGKIKEAYYYKTGTAPVYCSAKGELYNPAITYYSDQGQTEVAEVKFDKTYYVNETEYQYDAMFPDDLNTYILKNTTLYDADGNPVDASSVTAEGGPYRLQTQAASDDLYAEYYTVPNRNKTYGGTYYGDPEDNILNSETWPDRQDMSKFAGTANRREGLPTPDGTPAGTYDGLKNFILAAGYPEEGEEQTPPVQKIEHIKKDVWYTMCFPFDLTDDQLESCFGAGYEVAQFCGVVENDEKTGIILQFTDAVTPDANGVVTKAHVPYMIHPNSMAVNEDGTPKETVFTLTGVKETQEMHDADQEVLMQHAVTQFFNDGTPFTFVGYGHNYLPSQVLIPQFAYFLGTKKGETYPRFFRQTGANDRASKSYWNKNIAVVLPGVDKNVASTINFSKIDSRVINSETEGKQVYEVWDYEEGYYNYICNEYKYVPTASASGVKSLANFDLQIVHTPLTETQPEEATAIEAVEKADSFVAADKFGKVYNISGQYVGKDLNNLPKGVYILNGKKYMVK